MRPDKQGVRKTNNAILFNNDLYSKHGEASNTNSLLTAVRSSEGEV
jgi:hypothetical protein